MRWLLGAAGGLLLLNLLPSTGPGIVAPTPRADSDQVLSGTPQLSTHGQTTVAATTGQNGQRPMLEPARRDPFSPTIPPPPVVAKAPTPAPVQTSPPVAAAPSAPPLNMSFAGRVIGPDGKQIIYVSFAETSLPIEQGKMLPNGYRVESISEDAIEFNYLALNTTARLTIPPAPRYETR